MIIMKTLTHMHTENSLNDAKASVRDMVCTAKSRGYEAVCLSDHGTLTGRDEFISICNEIGIKPIIGVEIYFKENVKDLDEPRQHIILYAKNNHGDYLISKIVTESNKKLDSKDIPIVDKEILEKYLKNQKDVIMTSACMSGVLGNILLENYKIEANIKKKRKAFDEMIYRTGIINSTKDGSLLDYCKSVHYDLTIQYEEKQREYKQHAQTVSDLKKNAKKTYKGKENIVKKLKEKEKKEGCLTEEDQKKMKNILEDIQHIQQQIQEADSLIPEEEGFRDKCLAEKRKINQHKKLYDDILKRYKELEEKINEANKLKKAPEVLYKKAVQKAVYFENLVGKGNYFLELQYHGLEQEAIIMPQLARISKEKQIPVVAANDAHIPTSSDNDVRAREILRSLKYNTFEPHTSYDEEMYIKTYHELSEALLKILPNDIVEEAISGCDNIGAMCNFVLKKEQHYPKFVSEIPGETANECLLRKIKENIPLKYPEGLTVEQKKRINREYQTMCNMNVADYHLIVQDFLEYGRLIGKIDVSSKEFQEDPFNIPKIRSMAEGKPGIGIGPGRGSAVGSAVCYILGITDVDPFKYNLLFERFLNPERVTMPDIDSDYKPDVRSWVIAYVKHLYGENAVCNILSKGTMQEKNAIRNAARIRGSEIYQMIESDYASTILFDAKKLLASNKKIKEAKDNLFEKYPRRQDFIKNMFDAKEKSSYIIQDAFSCEKKVKNAERAFKKGIKQVKEHIKSQYLVYSDRLCAALGNENLQQHGFDQFASNTEMMKIISDARLIEGTLSNYTTHAAGIIIADNHDISEYTALLWNKEKGFVSQCDKEQAEEKGLLKMDFLGLRNLGIITEAEKLIQKRHGKVIEIRDVPFEEEVFEKIYTQGLTNSVFQCESQGMRKMMMQFKPESINDLIILVAMYRPGPLQFLPDVIAVKNGKKKVSYLHEKLQPILSNTYGAIVYQEQVMEIFQKLAGYSLGGADLVRRAMSKKKTSALEKERKAFVYGEHSSNRDIVGCIANGVDEKTANILFDQMMEFSKYAFNKSHACVYAIVSYYTAWLKYHYTIEYMCAVLNDEEFEKIPFVIEDCKKLGIHLLPTDINTSMDEFCIIDDHHIQIGLQHIKNVGSNIAKEVVEERTVNGKFQSLADFVERTSAKSNAIEAMIKSGSFDNFSISRTTQLETLKIIQKNKESCQIEKLLDIPYHSDRKKDCIVMEKEYLGFFISGHPLDYYEDSSRHTAIADLDEYPNAIIMAYISNANIVKSKKTGENLAFLTVEDKTGSIEVIVFSKEYEKFQNIIEEGNVLIIKGQTKLNTYQDETKLQMIVRSMTLCQEKKNTIVVECCYNQFENVYKKLLNYESRYGNSAIWLNTDNGKFCKMKLSLDESVLKSDLHCRLL